MIRAIALLHQHQRPRRTVSHGGRQLPYIEVEPGDVALANRLAGRVLGRSLSELQPGARRLLAALEALVAERARARETKRERVRFSRRELREVLCLGDTQLKVHLARLVDLELLHAQRGPHGRYHYELAWDGSGQGGEPRLEGLTDPASLARDPDRSGPQVDRSGDGRPPVGGRSGGGRPAAPAANSLQDSAFERVGGGKGANDVAPASDSRPSVAVAGERG